MSLIICTECGKEFSDKAPACPQCGCPTEEVLKSINTTNLVEAEEASSQSGKTSVLRDYLEQIRSLELDIYTSNRIIEGLQNTKVSVPERKSPEPLDKNSVEAEEKEIFRNQYKEELAKKYKKTDIEYAGIFSAIYPVKKREPYLHEIMSKFEYMISPHGYRLERVDYEKYVHRHTVGNKHEQEKTDRVNRIIDEHNTVNVPRNQRLYQERVNARLQAPFIEYEEYKKECEQIKQFNQEIDCQIKIIQEGIKSSQNSLQQLYNLDIIYPKYRGMIPVTMFCEYMDAGRRSTLEGIHGMYDLYESEFLAQKIVGELSQINKSLETINYQIEGIASQLNDVQRNQVMVYEEVARGNHIAQQICRNTSQIASRAGEMNDSLNSLKSELYKSNLSLDELNRKMHQTNVELSNRLDGIQKSTDRVAFETAVQARSVSAIARMEEYEFVLKHSPLSKD